jgi:hypothetical protein
MNAKTPTPTQFACFRQKSTAYGSLRVEVAL